MRLRTAINDYKTRRDAPFPGEVPTRTGAFSGCRDRLVHVDGDGSIRDYSAELSGLNGVDRSRFGIDTGERIHWFGETEQIRQHYYRGTNLVETEYDAGAFSIHQFDLTLGRTHLTHVELRGEVPADATLVAFLTLAPEGEETQVARLVHEDVGEESDRVAEVYHRREHDYVATSTEMAAAVGNRVERIAEVLDDAPIEYPRERGAEKLESEILTGDTVVAAELERAGRAARTTLVTQLADHEETTRSQALRDVTWTARSHATVDAVRAAARERASADVSPDLPRRTEVRADLRALSLLRAPTGARLAAPEFDPFLEHSGGYGYTWFRDDSEVSASLLAATDALDLGLTEDLIESARLYCRTQRPDGRWPHRIWAVDERLAPGWANGRVEGDGEAYQADQTAAVTAYLATLLRTHEDALDPADRSRIVDTLSAAVDALDADLDDDGLPVTCQNAWEDMTGRFAHTAAAFLEGYAAVARAPVGQELRGRAATQAGAVFDGLDALWSEERGLYGLRLDDGDLDDRADSASLKLVSAVAEYGHLVDLDDATLDRIREHAETVVESLYRDADDGVAGLIRYEGDEWRTAGQDGEKLWSVATALGAVSLAKLGALLDREDEPTDGVLDRAGELSSLLLADGPFTNEAGMLAEQVFDDGRIDSATPLGWTHAVRLETTALLDDLAALPTATTLDGPADRPHWTTGEKYGVGTVADHRSEEPSKVWFTLTEGALTEVRFPRVDTMNLRTMDFLVVDTDSEYVARTHRETRTDAHASSIDRSAEMVDDDALRYRHTVRETGDGRGHEWTLQATYVADPDHDAVLADVAFAADDDTAYEVYAVVDTLLTNPGTTDHGLRMGHEGAYSLAARDASAFDEHEEAPPQVDEHGDPFNVALALTSESRFEWGSVEVAGSERIDRLFVDSSRPDPSEHAEEESLVLVGQLGTGESLADTVALGFAEDADTAAALGEADGALTRGFERVSTDYVERWRSFVDDLDLPDAVSDDAELAAQYRTAMMTLRACEDKTFHGAAIASPSVPWGDALPADQPKGYGYNFVWSRDLYQTFTAVAAAGDWETAHDALAYIYEYQQDEQGFVPQNTYLQGRTRWGGEQMDNVSFPQVMAYHLAQAGVSFEEADYGYENVRRSSDYVVRNGPTTAQERWEEESGYSPSSIAAEVAGLTCAAWLARDRGATGDALVWQAVADAWADRVEEWTATEEGVDGYDRTPYYVRITQDGDPDDPRRRALANGGPRLDERAIVDAGFLELVRLGIRSADHETVTNSVRLVDDTIRVETPNGPGFYRYVGDGYGELGDDREGAPWSPQDPDGKGRLWPIFTGERGEYELLADGRDDPERLLRAMAEFANSGRMIPEQVWDRERPTAYDWTFGEGTGSATPLVWSMAQFVRLAHGIDAGEPVETPAAVHERFLERDRPAGPALWVDTAYESDHLVVTVETDAALVAVKTPAETVVTEPTGDEFVVRVATAPCENHVTVAAATDTDVATAGTTVEQRRL